MVEALAMFIGAGWDAFPGGANSKRGYHHTKGTYRLSDLNTNHLLYNQNGIATGYARSSVLFLVVFKIHIFSECSNFCVITYLAAFSSSNLPTFFMFLLSILCILADCTCSALASNA